MSDHLAAHVYLTPPTGSFWAWADGGRSIAWANGETIAFRQELLACMERLAVGGLPPFSAIVLLLAATRDGWTSTSPQLVANAGRLVPPSGEGPASTSVALRAVRHRLEKHVATLVAGLDRVAALPPELRHSLAAKALLAEVVFEHVQRSIAPDVAAPVVHELQSSSDPDQFDVGEARIDVVHDIVESIDSLTLGSQSIDAEHLRRRAKTGLDSELQEPQEDLDLARRVRHLLGTLADDAELGGLTRLARTLLAAVHVPRSLRHHEELPIGGVCDVTNRGQLDRLLISELAQDDLTLAVRVAMNEALYLQRESPPHQPPRRRVLLLDAGIRTWGVPRIYIAAVGLALAATGDTRASLNCFRAEGDAVVPIDLTTRKGLESHLAALQPLPHFGAALPAFLREIGIDDTDPAEVFVITQEEALEDLNCRRALAALDRLSGYAATVSRDGAFRLWALGPAGRSLVRQAQLDLDRLLAPPVKRPVRPRVPLLDPSSKLPLILTLTPFPLLLGKGSRLKQITSDNLGARVAITEDRQLLLVDTPGCGARLLTDRLPPGHLDLLRFADSGDAIVAVFTSHASGGASRSTLVLADRTSDSIERIPLTGLTSEPRAVTLVDGTLFVVARDAVHAYDARSGALLATAQTEKDGYGWVRGRLFYSYRAGWFLAALTGVSLAFEKVSVPVGHAPFEIIGIEGPLAMTRDGEIQNLAHASQVLCDALGDDVYFEGVAHDGWAIAINRISKKQRYFRDFRRKGGWSATDASLRDVLNGSARYGWLKRQHCNDFKGIYVARSGELVLDAASGQQRAIRLSGSDLILVETAEGHGQSDRGYQRFGRTPSPRGTRYRLHRTTWPEGSMAFLDSRGFLHLKSADKTIPEMTIGLNDERLAGWSSDGRLYGPKFYHGSNTAHIGSHLYDLIHRFSERLQ